MTSNFPRTARAGAVVAVLGSVASSSASTLYLAYDTPPPEYQSKTGFLLYRPGTRELAMGGAGVQWPVWKVTVAADVSVIHATGRDDPADRRLAFSLDVAF